MNSELGDTREDVRKKLIYLLTITICNCSSFLAAIPRYCWVGSRKKEKRVYHKQMKVLMPLRLAHEAIP